MCKCNIGIQCPQIAHGDLCPMFRMQAHNAVFSQSHAHEHQIGLHQTYMYTDMRQLVFFCVVILRSRSTQPTAYTPYACARTSLHYVRAAKNAEYSATHTHTLLGNVFSGQKHGLDNYYDTETESLNTWICHRKTTCSREYLRLPRVKAMSDTALFDDDLYKVELLIEIFDFDTTSTL